MAGVGFEAGVFVSGGLVILSIHRFSIADVWCDVVMASLVSIGVRYVVIAPGSRSTPLVLAAHRHDQLTIKTHFDERGLGFFALGLAKSSGRAVAVVVTSGTAVANLLPAVVEAFQTGVPLVLLTADRPPELWDSGANQCIRQVGIFSHFVVSEWCMPVPTLDIALPQIRRQLDALWVRLNGNRPGPIHLNCPFREPLHGESLTEFLASDALDSQPALPTISDRPQLDDFLAWVSSGNGVIVVGQTHSADDASALLELADRLGWMILPDATSSLHSLGHPRIFNHYDRALEATGPDLFLSVDRVLIFGGFCVSKVLISWLSTSRLSIYQVMNKDLIWEPNLTISKRIVAPWKAFCHGLISAIPSDFSPEFTNAFSSGLRDLNADITHHIAEVVDTPLTEPWIGAYLYLLLPQGWALMIGNSLPVRLLDQWALPADQLVEVHSNRGASGIDGVIATGTGVAMGCQKPVLIWLGDMSFSYDVSSLALVAASPVPIIILVTNNRGGRIFEQLSVASSAEVFESYFVLPDLPSIEYASRMVGLPYHLVESSAQLTALFSSLGTSPMSCVIEVQCESSHIGRCLTALHTLIQSSIRS